VYGTGTDGWLLKADYSHAILKPEHKRLGQARLAHQLLRFCDIVLNALKAD
jgi:hypothetical protein